MRLGYPVSLPKRRVHEIVGIAADVFGVSSTGIIGLSRKRHLVRARQAVCLVAYEHGWATKHIGERLSGRDHSTICYAKDEAVFWGGRDVEFRQRLTRLRYLALPPKRELVLAASQPFLPHEVGAQGWCAARGVSRCAA